MGFNVHYFVKYPEIQKKVKRYPGLKKLLGCSPGGRLPFVGKCWVMYAIYFCAGLGSELE